MRLLKLLQVKKSWVNIGFIVIICFCKISNIHSYINNRFINHHHRPFHQSLVLSAQQSSDSTSNFQSEDTELVLEAAERTDRGSKSTPEIDTKLSEWIELKSNEYTKQKKLAKNDMNLFGNYDVSYAGPGINQKGQPAGGAFRGTLGKLFFKTDKLLQNIIQNEKNEIQVIDVLKGRIFSFIPFRVILYGIATYLQEKDRNTLSKKLNRNFTESTIRADFEPPVICFGNEWNKFSFSIRIGPKSNVALDTPYVDQRIRLGIGGRGSLFIFKRTFDMMANEWQIWKEQKKPVSGKLCGKILVMTGIISNLLEYYVLKNIHKFILKKVFFLPGTLITLLGVYLLSSYGGIFRDNPDAMS
jgi:hypothetical protein